jgi:GxxExxY protein
LAGSIWLLFFAKIHQFNLIGIAVIFFRVFRVFCGSICLSRRARQPTTEHTEHTAGLAMTKLIHADETHALLGACFEVYREKGCGFLEAVFQECLELELGDRAIPFQARAPLLLSYKGRPLRQTYQPDFLCYEKVILEIKAVSKLADEHRAQVHNYLRAANLRVGLLVNFGHYPLVEYDRIVI